MGKLQLDKLDKARGKDDILRRVKQLKIIIEKHSDGYVAYPLGMKGVVVGEGNSYEEALQDVRSAIRSHIETFGPNVFEEEESPVLEAFIAETGHGAAA